MKMMLLLLLLVLLVCGCHLMLSIGRLSRIGRRMSMARSSFCRRRRW
jgi:hypothetical protein